jgi:hypothetical protein
MRQWSLSPWYLRVVFDDSGNVEHFSAHPS